MDFSPPIKLSHKTQSDKLLGRGWPACKIAFPVQHKRLQLHRFGWLLCLLLWRTS